MSNTIITSRIAIPFVAEVESAMPILMNGNRQFDKNFVGGHGTTIDVIIPGYGAVHVGADMSGVDLSYTAAKVSVTLVQRNVGVSVTQVEQSLELSNFDEQVAAPYGTKLGSDVQKVAAAELLLKADTATVVDASSTIANANYSLIGQAVAFIRAARSSGVLFGALSNELAAYIQNSAFNFFNPSKSIENSFLVGGIGKFRGADWYETPDILNLTAGTCVIVGALTGTVNAGGDTLTLTAGTSFTGYIEQGEVINLAGVKAVDIYGVALSANYAFVVQARSAVATGGTTLALSIKPVYFKSSTVQNPLTNINTVDAMPTALTATRLTAANGVYLRGIAWDKMAFVYAAATLKPLAMVEAKAAPGQALSVLCQRGTDVIKGIDIVRWDVLTGFLLARSNWVSSILVKIA